MGRKVKYIYEFKLCCVKVVLNECCLVKLVVKEYGFNEVNFCLWVGFYQIYGIFGFKVW